MSLKKEGGINATLKCEYDLYRKNQIFAACIIGIVLISTFGIYQIYVAPDSIVEIYFDKDFYMAEGISMENLVNGSDIRNFTDVQDMSMNIQIIMYFVSPDVQFAFLDWEDRVRFFMKPALFSGVADELWETNQVFKAIGFFSVTKDVLIPNTSYKIRVPRGLHFTFMQIIFTNEPNFYRYSEFSISQFYFQLTMIGVPNATVEETITDYKKLTFNIHNMFYNATAHQYIDDIRNNASRIAENVIPSLDYVVNTTITKEYSWDLLNPNIK